MLRISIHEGDEKIEMALVGRLAGPWVVELEQVWKNIAPSVAGRKVSLDLRDVTYSDSQGLQVLAAIFKATHAEFVTSSIWSKYMAAEISNTNGIQGKSRGVEHGNHG